MRVTILSFSYKRGLPEDKTGNGGGFVFDCRAMPNPYWDESLRGYTGRDKPIADFFDRYNDKVDCFLGAAFFDAPYQADGEAITLLQLMESMA